jgi:hypothetical protein
MQVFFKEYKDKNARENIGAHHALVKELSDEDLQGFRNFLRMDARDFFLIMRRLNVPQMFFFLIYK